MLKSKSKIKIRAKINHVTDPPRILASLQKGGDKNLLETMPDWTVIQIVRDHPPGDPSQ